MTEVEYICEIGRKTMVHTMISGQLTCSMYTCHMVVFLMELTVVSHVLYTFSFQFG